MAATKILIVDDSATEQANLKAIVSGAGWIPVCAGNGAEALQKAKSEQPHVVLMDVLMPEVDGYQACRALRADPATKAIPVVIITTKGQKADHLWARMQGARELIPKPYTGEQVLGAIRAALA